MQHEHDEGRDQSRSAAGRGHDGGEPASSIDRDSTSPDGRSGDSGRSPANSAVSAERSEVDTADEAIDAEIVEDQPVGIRSVISSWSGELPHPDDAERYEKLCPGAFDRLVMLNERRLTVVEREVAISERRAETIHAAVEGEVEVKRTLAMADSHALKRGQLLSWSIGAAAIGAAILGLCLGYPQALWAIVVPVVQAGPSLVRTVTQAAERGKPNHPSD